MAGDLPSAVKRGRGHDPSHSWLVKCTDLDGSQYGNQATRRKAAGDELALTCIDLAPGKLGTALCV